MLRGHPLLRHTHGGAFLINIVNPRPSADTVTNEYRAHYHQLAIVLLKSSCHDEFSIGDRLWLSYYIMKTSTSQSPTDDNVLGIN